MLRSERGGPDVLVGVCLMISNLRSMPFHLTKQMPDIVPMAKSPLVVFVIEWKVLIVLARLN